jgi:hypothetical protein
MSDDNIITPEAVEAARCARLHRRSGIELVCAADIAMQPVR